MKLNIDKIFEFISASNERYEKISCISKNSGNAYIFKVKDKNNKIKCIKLLKYNDNAQNKVYRFNSEYHIQNTLQHENIVKAYDFGKYDEYPFYVMDYYEHSLRDLISQIDKAYNMYIKYILQLCQALKYIHNKSIYHRDLKPENILYDQEKDRVLLCDFGIAKSNVDNITKPHDKMCNFDYHAPEQGIVNKNNVGSYTDIYSLGLIINELFTGIIPKGVNYTKIADTLPLYSFLDNIVSSMIIHDFTFRENNIDNIIMKITYEHNKVKKIINTYDKYINYYMNTGYVLNEKTRLYIINDLFIAKNYFINNIEYDNINLCYHMHISYTLLQPILDEIILIKILEIVKRKFNYEGNVLLDINSSNDTLHFNEKYSIDLYNEIYSILNNLNDKDDLIPHILKFFRCIKDYHAKEALDEINSIQDTINELTNAPLLYIMSYIKNSLDIAKDYLHYNSSNLFDKIIKNIILEITDTNDVESNLINTNSETKMFFDILSNKFSSVLCVENSKYMFTIADSLKFESYINELLVAPSTSFVDEGDLLDVINSKEELENYCCYNISSCCYRFFKP